jgi:hypothetical protein
VVMTLPGILDIGQIEKVLRHHIDGTHMSMSVGVNATLDAVGGITTGKNLQHLGVYAWGPKFTELLENAVQARMTIRAIEYESCGYVASAASWVEKLGIPDIDPPFQTDDFD